jgi:hypothetical protein
VILGFQRTATASEADDMAAGQWCAIIWKIQGLKVGVI